MCTASRAEFPNSFIVQFWLRCRQLLAPLNAIELHCEAYSNKISILYFFSAKPMNNIEPAEIVNLFWMPLGDTVGQHNGKSKIDKRGWEKLNGAYGKRVGK